MPRRVTQTEEEEEEEEEERGSQELLKEQALGLG